MSNIFRIARKEFAGFFSSPTAFIFLGAFLAVNLFVFFWVETFFARNIADARPLFEWMPLLLIFLTAAITMRMWAEERRAGTLEFLLTLPVKSYELVLGKFLACVALVAVAITLTFPLPVTVSLLGPLDWGPVFGGYLATLFLAAAYIAIGLFISARSANQIVSLILTTAVCGFFYLLGSDALTALFGNQASEFLKLLGSGSRFESITRGVIDVRDLYYYLSLTGVFLALNVLALEWLRWAGNPRNANHRRWGWLTGLVAANFVAANLWLAPIGGARADITEGNVYSISQATRSYLAQLREPLLIRGYFSAQTHPLLAPLVPRLRDLLEEYAVASDGRARVEFIDPQGHPELEQEANEKFGIRPVPFQFASKYQASVVNSYFNILVQYGDQHEVLGFRDLIEVKVQGETDLDVELRNPEYDLTQAIKKVLYAYQGAGELFENINHPVTFRGYISDDERLPQVLQDFKQNLEEILNELSDKANGKLSIDIQDPDAEQGALAERLQTEFGFRPMTASLFDTSTFWFYMTLEGDDRIVQVPLPEGFEKAALARSIEAGLKRFSRGLLKTVALHTPEVPPSMNQFGAMAVGKRFSWLRDTLAEEHDIVEADLEDGQVPANADLLLLASPEKLDKKQLFAVDQFLMRGGTIIAATSPFDVDSRGELSAKEHDSGLTDWLSHHGITLEEQTVLDPQNAAFPIPVNRRLAGFVVRETQLVDYPYFVDVRGEGLVDQDGITAGLSQVTMTWPSPITVDPEKSQARKVSRLLESSQGAWTSDSLDIQPDFRGYGKLGFPVGEDRGRRLLAVAVEGRFDSFFKDKPSPLEVEKESSTTEPKPEGGESNETPEAAEQDATEPVITRIIEHSPESARIILFASNSFLTDEMLDLAASGLGTRYLKPVQLVENAVDWSLEDRGLLSIRGRAQFSRTLDPLGRDAQMFWEYLNYGLALLGLLMVWLLRRQVDKQTKRRNAAILGNA
jgi:ABC-2 type transport system permease protein